MNFDIERAWLAKPDHFPRFTVPARGEALRSAGLGADDSLIIVERGGDRRALRLREMAFRHAAQGELGGEPYLVSF